MLLVVGVLLLVLIVGMTYIHVVQEDRRAGLTVDVDAIVLAQADLAAATLLADLSVGPTGQHFADIHTNGTTNGTPDGIPDQEPFDYPGDLDKWLAATAPEGVGTSWSQVSLFGEAFWNGTNSTTDTTRTLTAASATTAKASNNAADADGDGIIDSKPEQASVFSRGGLLFFAWSRIQDSSSLANIDVWHSQVSALNTYSTTEPPRWWYPGELDLGNLAASISSVHTDYSAVMFNVQNILDKRGIGSTIPTPWGFEASTQRGHSYFHGSKRYGNPAAPHDSLVLDASNSFDSSNEMELRYRNGLVYLDSEAEIEQIGWFRTILRGHKTSAESAWNASGGPPGVTTIADYFTNEPRHQFTTYSGASIYRMPMGGDTSTPFWGKRDLNAILAGANPAQELSADFAKVFASGTPPLPSGVTTAAELADQLAVNFVDYADADNVVTAYNGRYGMEMLPFITEAYSQIAYVITGHAGDGPPAWTCTLAAQDPAWAVEMRNPFPVPISLENVRLVLNNTGTGVRTPLSTLSALTGQTTLAVGKAVIVYHNSAGDPNGDVTPLFDTTNAPITATALATWPTNITGLTDCLIEMEVLDSDGAWVVYQKVPGKSYNKGYTGPHTTIDTADPTGKSWTVQTLSTGNGNGINAMSVQQTEFLRTIKGFGYENYDGSFGTLGQANKGLAGPPDQFSATADQLVFNQSGVISHVGEILTVPVMGPTSTLPIPEVIGSATTLDELKLDPANIALVNNNADYQVPHAVLLMDRLTTLSPREDSVDNDGDGTIDNASELFIPGSLNLNTAPKALLNQVLPIANPTVRSNYVDAIVAYRDTPGMTNRVRNCRASRKGLAYVAETYNLGALASGWDFGRNTVDDFNNPAMGSIQGDFLSNPAAGADGIIDDREEKTFVPRWLAQTCSTRSDVYVAYILVRGYSPGNLTTPVTERRAAVLLDRSRVATQDDGVRVLGILWY